MLVPDVVDHYSLPGLPPGREGWNMNRKILRTAFPDCAWHEEDLFAEGDRVTFLDVHKTCHACWYCLVAKASTRCPKRKVYGITYGLQDGLIEVYTVKDGKTVSLFFDAELKLVKTEG